MKYVGSCLMHVLVMLTMVVTANAQAPAWQTVVASTSLNGSDVFVEAVATDAIGNAFITGNFSGTVSFGSATLVSAGGTDAFLAKWSNVTHAFVWAHRVGGAANDEAHAVAVSGTGIYVTGRFQGTASFGGGTLTSVNNTADGFVTKLIDSGSTGAFSWSQALGGNNAEEARAIAVSGSSVYVAGIFTGATSLGGTSFISTGGFSDSFVVKILDGGSTPTVSWATQIGGAAEDWAYALAVAGTAVYVVGETGSSPQVFGSNGLTATGAGRSFVAKLTDAGAVGSFVWATHCGNAGFASLTGAVAVQGNNIYVAGHFTGSTAVFGATSLVNAGAVGYGDVFVAKLVDAGSTVAFSWAQRAGAADYDGALGLAVSGTAVFLAGFFYSPVVVFGPSSLVSAGNQDLFLAKLLDMGATSRFVWGQQAGGTGYDAGSAVAVTGNGSVLVAGNNSAPATFGSLTLANPSNSHAVFVASLADPTLTATAAAWAADGLTLAPNPAHTAATVHLPAVPGATLATLTLFDALGRVVRTQALPLPAVGATAELALMGLAPGLYHLLAQAGSRQANCQLVIE